jgi:oligoendopeptidase F
MTATKFLDFLNVELYRLHNEYEVLFWDAYMGNAKVGKKKDRALEALNAFRGSREHKATAEAYATKVSGDVQERLLIWVRFFALYQVPETTVMLQTKIAALETEIQNKRAGQTEGYIDPDTKEFITASSLKMRTMIQTHHDERVRKACFTARESLALACVPEYVTLVKLRNEFATGLGYRDFYDYKLQHIDNMTKDELFGIFGEIVTAAQPNFATIRTLEKTNPGLRKPWNFAYKMTGDFVAEEDQYYPFAEAIPRWLDSFAKLGISFASGTLKLDLVERTGKYNNGFCHWPELVHYTKGKRQPGSANFTCNVTPNQVGSGVVAYATLFHEGGHAAHFLNTTQRDICLNHEYAPMTAAWAETQSMFMDTLFASQEWRRRYAKNAAGEVYPEELFARKVKATSPLQTGRIMSIVFLATFERQVYELQTPTAEKIIRIAKKVYREMYDQSADSLQALNTPHIYSWESACSYHGYGLAEVALHQWRAYFMEKYGYIVDNPAVGQELKEAWSWGARYDFKTSVKKATGKNLNAKALVRHMTRQPATIIREAKKQEKILTGVQTKKVNLDVTLELVHGKRLIADSRNGVVNMVNVYRTWYSKLK